MLFNAFLRRLRRLAWPLLKQESWRARIGCGLSHGIPQNACLHKHAQEHHLQAVLSAASHRATTLLQNTVNGSTENIDGPRRTSAAYIPVPDAAGLVENYGDLYPSDKWKEPATYVKFSRTVDECITLSLAEGFTYVMDERDAEWLEKNNQEARGEGTSSQVSGSSSGSGTTTRSGGHRSAKSRGKEAESNSVFAISEDEFELVMGLFERITHDSTPFLHVVRLLNLRI